MQKHLTLTAAAMMLSTMLACNGSALAAGMPDNRDVLRSTNGNIVVNSYENCVRTQWVAGNDACAPEHKAKRRTLAQQERTVYFRFNQASLTPQAQRKLESLANVLKSEESVKEARIVGYADRIGNAAYNEKLSRRRAESVRKYIVSRGFVNARVAETRWLGESAPVTNCPDTLSRTQLIECLQKDRRVEVEIDYLPDGEARKRR